MKLNLPSGKRVELYFKHTTEPRLNAKGEEVWNYRQTRDKQGKLVYAYVLETCRSTTGYLTFVDDYTTYVEYAICHSEDQFNKEYGRKLVLRKILNSIENDIKTLEKTKDAYDIVLSKKIKLTKEDKHFLWYITLPRKINTAYYVKKKRKK